MKDVKPENTEQYIKWLRETLNIIISKRHENHYESVTKNVKTDFENSKFWHDLIDNLKEFNDEYYLQTKYDLLASGFKPIILIKDYDKFLNKTLRKNIIERENWNDEPENGWIVPDNWFMKINDIIRTEIVVKYLDGVEFIKNKIELLCKKYNQKCICSYEARIEGYYAVHINTCQLFEIPKINYDTEKIEIPIEIQITTQLQDTIRKLLHKYYEARRGKIEKNGKDWMWDYESNEFITNYLGHILHYVEGMIMDVREKQKREMK